MEQEYDEPLNEQPSEEYLKGFNNAYVIGTYQPELLNEITQEINAHSPYFDGFFDGKVQWQQEQETAMMRDLQSIRERQQEQKHER